MRKNVQVFFEFHSIRMKFLPFFFAKFCVFCSSALSCVFFSFFFCRLQPVAGSAFILLLSLAVSFFVSLFDLCFFFFLDFLGRRRRCRCSLINSCVSSKQTRAFSACFGLKKIKKKITAPQRICLWALNGFLCVIAHSLHFSPTLSID